MLKEIERFVSAMNEKNTVSHKKRILETYKSNKNIIKLLFYVYSEDILFHCTSSAIKKYRCHSSPISSEPLPLFDVLDNLKNRTVTGNEALRLASTFLAQNINGEEMFYRIIDKNLKIRVQRKIIEQVIPNLFPKFHVSLANSYKPHLVQHGQWFISRKLDGVRCIVHVDRNKAQVHCYSRMGKLFHTLNKLKEEILKNLNRFTTNLYLDGEIVQFGSDGKDHFKAVMKNIHRKNFTMENPLFHIFDCITEDDFHCGVSSITFSQRQQSLEHLFQGAKLQYCNVVCQYPFDSLEFLLEKMKQQNWEGLMVRKDGPWEGKRSNSLLKIKTMQDEEFRVLELEMGPFRYLDRTIGQEKEKITLASVVIDYHGTRVGSGFSMEERDEFYRHPERLLHKMIVVQYFEKTESKLRFPVFKGIRDEFC